MRIFPPMMEEQLLTITAIGASGDGIARGVGGEPIFVPFAVRGDIVRAEILRGPKGALRGKILVLEQAGPDRAASPCRHFGVCGGCSLQHMTEDAYRAFKKTAVTDVLEKAGIAVPQNVECIFIPPGTRRRANFAARIVKGKAIIGFHERKSENIRDVPDCLLITEDVREVMEGMRGFLPVIAGIGGAKMDVLVQCAGGEREVGLTGKIAPGWEAQQALSDALRTLGLARISLRARDYEAYEILLEAKPYSMAFDSLVVNLAPGAFLQPAAEGERALAECVMNGVGDASCIADLFCGNGTFTGPLMGRAEKLIAADFAPDAIRSLQKAGVNAQLRNLFKDPLTAEKLGGYDCAVIDPPRAGARAQVQELARSHVPRIVYISCSAKSFAADAALLLEAGFALEKLTVVDQFTWSVHTELAGVFTRKAV
ncbi:MAG: TRAM domain-containing protein [Micavibrio sp.]